MLRIKLKPVGFVGKLLVITTEVCLFIGSNRSSNSTPIVRIKGGWVGVGV